MRDGNCIFCKILDGRIPAIEVFRDDACLAFMDIGPLAEGHVLLIPADHAESVDQLTGEQAAGMLRHLPDLAKAVRAATGCEGLNILQNNARIAGQLVMHVHFHIIPRSPGDAFQFNWPAGQYPEGRAEQIAEAIRQQLS
jgi:histidine triad (HIT) family protein